MIWIGDEAILDTVPREALEELSLEELDRVRIVIAKLGRWPGGFVTMATEELLDAVDSIAMPKRLAKVATRHAVEDELMTKIILNGDLINGQTMTISPPHPYCLCTI